MTTSFRRPRALLLALLALAGCTAVQQELSRRPRPDIPELYRESVNNDDRNPVILVLGMGGSVLSRQSDGKIVWGELFSDDVLDISSPVGLRALVLDLWQLPRHIDQRQLATLQDDVVATRPLGRLRADALVTDVELNVYASLLALLGAHGYTEDDPESPVYDQSTTSCFIFAYDWRLDNVANAQALGRFIARARLRVEEQRRQHGLPARQVRFDVVAHSMGGLIARYYLRYGSRDVLDAPESAAITWEGARDIDRLVLVAPPNFGSMVMLQRLVTGRRLAPLLPKVEPVMLASMVSPYQMLPRPGTRWLVNAAGLPVDLDLLSAKTWEANDWGPFAADQDPYLQWIFPSEPDRQGRRQRLMAFMDAALERGRRFATALDRRPERPCPAVLTLFAGDARPTLQRALVAPKGTKLELLFEGPPELELTAPGDGRVTRASALADLRSLGAPGPWLRSPIPWSHAMFINDSHLGLTKNPNFQNNLLHQLLELPPPARSPALP